MPSAFLFPGQGSQYVGMAQNLCATLPAARRLFDEAAAILGYDLLTCVPPAPRNAQRHRRQPARHLRRQPGRPGIAASQPSRRWKPASSPRPGLSLGEYSALVFAGVLSFADGLRVVKVRGEAMQAAADGDARGHGQRPRPGDAAGRGTVPAGPRRKVSCRWRICSARAISSSPACEPASRPWSGW